VRASLLIGFLFVAACDPSSPSPVTLDTFSAELKSAMCQLGTTCGEFASAAACEEATCFDVVPASVQDELEAGTVKFDGEIAAACLERLRGLACQTGEDFRFDFDNPCDAFVGTVADGEPCPCIDNKAGDYPTCLTCASGRCSDGEGICAFSTRQPGEPCRSDDCADGEYCAADGECKARLAEGATCQPGEIDPCAIGTLCYPDGEGAACKRPPATGEACTPSQAFGGDDCLDGPKGAFCDPEELVCKAPGQPGEACTGEGSSACAGFAYCDAGGMCQKRGELDDACDDSDDTCLQGLFCAEGKCVPEGCELAE
jgi:hypothetical protein